MRSYPASPHHSSTLDAPTFAYSQQPHPSHESSLPAAAAHHPRPSNSTPTWWQRAKNAASAVVTNLMLDSDEWEGSSDSDDHKKTGHRSVPHPPFSDAQMTVTQRQGQSPSRPATSREKDLAVARSLLPQGWIREVAEKTRTSSIKKPSSGLGDYEQTLNSISPAKETKVLQRAYAFYCTPLGMVAGILSLSEKVITFEPDRRGAEVKLHGLGEFQVVIPISEVSETAAVVLPRTRPIENLFNLPPEPHESSSTGIHSTPAWLFETNRRGHLEEDPEPAIGLLQILLKPSRRGYHPKASQKKNSKSSSHSTKNASPTDRMTRSAESRESDSRSPPTLDLTWLAFPKQPPPGSYRSDGVLSGSLDMDAPVTPRSEMSKKENSEDITLCDHDGGSTVVPQPHHQSLVAQRRRSAAKLIDINAVPPQPRRADTIRAPRRTSKDELLGDSSAHRRRSVDDLRSQLLEKSGDSSRKSASGTTKVSVTMKKPMKSFVLFRLSSTRSVKEFTRYLLDIIDEYNSAGTESSVDTQRRASSVEAFPASHQVDIKMIRNPNLDSAELMKSHEAGTNSHWAAYVPHLSNASLDLLMTLCLDQSPPSIPSKHGRVTSGSQTESHSPIHNAPSSLEGPSAAWLFRTSPPKLDCLPGSTPIFNEDMSLQLSAALPPTVALRKWRLLFDTNLHGVSMQTFFQRCEGHRPALLVIKDEANTCFGGYNPEGFKESHHYYGNGETFVFTYRIESGAEHGDLQVYGWSGKNDFFVYSDTERLIFGGGGSFAFALDKDFLQGNSGQCHTFMNPPLTASEDFRIGDLQVWGFEKL